MKDGKAFDSGKTDFIRKFLLGKKILVLIYGPSKNVIRFVPPLNVDDGLPEHVLNIMEKALHQKP